MTVTTKHLAEIRRRNALGENDVVIANALGISKVSVGNYRKRMGIPAVRKHHRHMEWMYYTVRDDMGKLLACGTAKECAAKMGYEDVVSFRNAVSRAVCGRQNGYVVAKEKVQ